MRLTGSSVAPPIGGSILVVGTSKRAVASTKTRRNGAWFPADWTDANDKMAAAAYFMPLSSRLRLQ
jgi:hypothetical protein